MCSQSAIDSSTIARASSFSGDGILGKGFRHLAQHCAPRQHHRSSKECGLHRRNASRALSVEERKGDSCAAAVAPSLRGFTQVALVIAQGVVDAGIVTQEQFDLATANCAVPHFHDQSPGGSQTQKLPKNSTSSQEQGFAVARCCARLIKHEIFVLRRLSVKRRSINRIIAI